MKNSDLQLAEVEIIKGLQFRHIGEETTILQNQSDRYEVILQSFCRNNAGVQTLFEQLLGKTASSVRLAAQKLYKSGFEQNFVFVCSQLILSINFNMEKKIDAVLSSIKVLTERVKSIEDKFELFESTFLTIDRRLAQQDEKINNLTNELDIIVKLSDFNEIRDRVNCLEKIAEDARREALRQESYNKRLNLLVYGVEELPNTVRENKLQTQMKFLKKG